MSPLTHIKTFTLLLLAHSIRVIPPCTSYNRTCLAHSPPHSLSSPPTRTVKCPETQTDGIESLPEAFLSVMAGGNMGKQVVKVASEPTEDFMWQMAAAANVVLPSFVKAHLAKQAEI